MTVKAFSHLNFFAIIYAISETLPLVRHMASGARGCRFDPRRTQSVIRASNYALAWVRRLGVQIGDIAVVTR